MKLETVIVAGMILCAWPQAAASMEEQRSVKADVAEEAQRLAEVLAAANLSESAIETALSQMTGALFEQQPDLAALNSVYPGVDKVFVDTMRPIIRDEMSRIRPLYVADLARLFGSKFTAPELTQLTQFWESEPAQNVLNAAIRNMDFAAMSSEMVDQVNSDSDKEIVFSETAVEKDIRQGFNKIGKDMGQTEREAFVRFSFSPLGKKFIQIREEKRVIDMKWTNGAMSPDLDKRIEAEIPKALELHIDKLERQKAGQAVNG